MERENRARLLAIPDAPRSIEKGSTLKNLIGPGAIECLAQHIGRVHRKFNAAGFRRDALLGLESLGIMARGQHVAAALRRHLPERYEDAVDILIRSLGPPLAKTKDLGMGVFFHLPHAAFVARYGVDAEHNAGEDPFEASMRAQYEITRRFTAEFSMRPFVIRWPERTLKRLLEWTRDPDPHVRRLCSEGTRSRLPWAARIPSLIKDPAPVLPILEALKDDSELYVRRSVANHIGDIAKDHPLVAFDLCERWLPGASPERRWIIRHAVRHPAKKGVKRALEIRKRAK